LPMIREPLKITPSMSTAIAGSLDAVRVSQNALQISYLFFKDYSIILITNSELNSQVLNLTDQPHCSFHVLHHILRRVLMMILTIKSLVKACPH
jgi:hypothetical protein